ncbi:MAG TPA: asparagine synthase-related protein, partial [Pyrinomonadaceae bacterium]|nr:asparagine synthase-related protein [Pyrinomonadaceae bacterium]
DHPIGVPNVFMDWAIFKTAEQRGVNVMLSGFDGDSAVSYGYEALPELVRQGKWIRLIRDSSALVKNMPHRQHTLRKLLWNQGFRPAIPESVRQLWRLAQGRPRVLPPDNRLPSVNAFGLKRLNPDFIKRVDPERRYLELREKEYPSGVDNATDSWNALRNGLFAFALETFEKLGAGRGIEPRFPFFDRRLIEFCIRMPSEQRLAGGWTRSILRRAMTGILPPKIQWRRDKANIGLSFKLNLLKFGRGEIEEAVGPGRRLLEPFFRMEMLDSALLKYEKDPLGRDGEPMLLLTAAHLSNWLRNESAGAPN